MLGPSLVVYRKWRFIRRRPALLDDRIACSDIERRPPQRCKVSAAVQLSGPARLTVAIAAIAIFLIKQIDWLWGSRSGQNSDCGSLAPLAGACPAQKPGQNIAQRLARGGSE